MSPGNRVRLRSSYLRDTGQAVGGEGFKRWNIVSCSCHRPFVAVDEFISEGWFTDDEIKDQPCLKFRHFDRNNLEVLL